MFVLAASEKQQTPEYSISHFFYEYAYGKDPVFLVVCLLCYEKRLLITEGYIKYVSFKRN